MFYTCSGCGERLVRAEMVDGYSECCNEYVESNFEDDVDE